MNDRVIIHSSNDRKEYFFSTDHCQPDIPEGFVRCTFYFPYSIVARPAFPTGVITTAEGIVKLHHSNDKEIPNPNPNYQP